MTLRKFSLSTISSNKSNKMVSSSLIDGLTPSTAAPSAKYLYDLGVRADGGYWIKGNGTRPYYMYCAMQAGGWMLMLAYKDNSTNNFTVMDIPSLKITYDFALANDTYNFTIPAAIESQCSYAAFSSNFDLVTPQSPTSESQFKYVIQYKDSGGTVRVDRIYNFITGAKTTGNFWGMGSVPGTPASYTTFNASSLGVSFKRFGTSFTSLYIGDDANRMAGRDESDTITLRNADGTGSITYTTGSHAYSRMGWGSVDCSGPNLTSASWGSNGRDLSDHNGTKISDKIFMWIK